MKDCLSIFCDESGDFGTNSPYYLLSLVFHDQNDSLEEPIEHLNRSLAYSNHKISNAVHSYPLIRNDREYKYLTLKERRKVFYSIVSFLRHATLNTKTLIVEKQNSDNIKCELVNSLSDFLTANLKYFKSYKKIIIYYDNGQRQISSILFEVFNKFFSSIEFRTIQPENYVLFQVADLACTLELLDMKFPNLTKNEIVFLCRTEDLKKRYLKSSIKNGLTSVVITAVPATAPLLKLVNFFVLLRVPQIALFYTRICCMCNWCAFYSIFCKQPV